MNAILREIRRAQCQPPGTVGEIKPDAEFTKVAAELLMGMEGDQMENFLEGMALFLADFGEDTGDPAWRKAAGALLLARTEIRGRMGN